MSQLALWWANPQRKPWVGRLDDVKDAIPKSVFSNELAQSVSLYRLSSLECFANPNSIQAKPRRQILENQIQRGDEPRSAFWREGPRRCVPVRIVSRGVVAVDVCDATAGPVRRDCRGTGAPGKPLKPSS